MFLRSANRFSGFTGARVITVGFGVATSWSVKRSSEQRQHGIVDLVLVDLHAANGASPAHRCQQSSARPPAEGYVARTLPRKRERYPLNPRPLTLDLGQSPAFLRLLPPRRSRNGRYGMEIEVGAAARVNRKKSVVG